MADRRKILLVEDEEEIRWILSKKLRDKGFEVIEAEDGFGGLACLSFGDVPDLVISDVRMPNMDGVKFLKTLRAEPRFADVPVLICSHDETFADLPIDMQAVRTTGKDFDVIVAMAIATKWRE